MQIWDCLGPGQTNQLWRVSWPNHEGGALIVNVGFAGRCLNVDGSFRNGWDAYLYTCDPPTSHWILYGIPGNEPPPPYWP